MEGWVGSTEITGKRRPKEESFPSDGVGHQNNNPKAKAFFPFPPCSESVAGVFPIQLNI
jgi:hypothetical protein